MNWWGKVIGSSVGLLAGPIGAIVGGYLGHQLDERSSPQRDEKKAKLLYYAYFFSAAAKIAKADGIISEKEINKVESIIQRMGLTQNLEKFAKDIFRKSKTSRRSIHRDFKECAELIQYDQSIAHSFMGGLFEIATCDNEKPRNSQIQCLLSGQEYFKMPQGTVRSWYAGGYATNESRKGTNDLIECYGILGIPKDASLAEVKSSYRRKMSALHPDKLENKQLPDELVVFAKEQVIRLNLAFEQIKKAHKG